MTQIPIHDQFFNHKTSIERPFLNEQLGLSPQGAVVFGKKKESPFDQAEV